MNETGTFNLSSVVNRATQVITKPVDFFRKMAKTGGYSEPIIFVVVMGLVTGLIIALFSLFAGSRTGLMGFGFTAIVLMPILAIIGSFVSAAILFVIWKLMGSQESFETAYRCIAYITAIYPLTVVLSLIPYLGAIVGIVWGTYLLILASEQVHRLNRNIAYIVFGIIGALLLVINLGAEMAGRRMQSQVEAMGEGTLKGFEKMTPEEAGRAMGEFLKGLEEAKQKTE